MKYIFALAVAIIYSSVCHADCKVGAEAANSFMNSYKKYSDDVMHRKTKETAEHWIQSNKNVTANFKKTYKSIVDEANKADPAMGLDFDPIFDAQDYPDKGFQILDCDEKTNLVTLSGKGWKEFKVVVKVISTDSAWLVDGAGIINIPKNLRARRD